MNNKTLTIDGSLTLGENMADIGGVQLAYRMYKKASKQITKGLSLPGLSQYTQKQQFWLALAQVWCGKQDEPNLKSKHSPWKYRVVGPLSQTPDFSRDWNCPTGAPMNPAEVCGLW